MLFAMAGVPFKDDRIPQANWPQVKDSKFICFTCIIDNQSLIRVSMIRVRFSSISRDTKRFLAIPGNRWNNPDTESGHFPTSCKMFW